jgi:hypothetical protein
MSALAQVQADLQGYLLGPGDGQGAIVPQVRAQAGLAPAARLAIYHRAYRSRLREALGEAYEKTWTYAGDELFGSLADAYLAAHTSQYRNLRWYGDRFAAHCAQALPDYPWLAELAAFEWALGLSFDAPDASPLDVNGLRGMAPEAWGEAVFCLHPSVRLLAMTWNSVALWQALNDGQEPPAPRAAAQAGNWVVWRTDGQPHFRSLDALEARALRLVGDGASFADVCEAAAEQGGGDPTSGMAGLLANWLAHGLLALPGHPQIHPL